MAFQSCLTDIELPLVVDASVIVNINATGQADRILGSISNDALVPSTVLKELERGELVGHGDAAALKSLIDANIVALLKIPSIAHGDYLNLTSGTSASSLGDGEAATIACASSLRHCAVIDEKKARRICAERYSHVFVQYI